MIPIKLEIKNFLSYGNKPQLIDFEPYSLICLSGKNGHGKSALLDAMTWAIWGQARKIAGKVKPDEGLLHLGQKHMRVSFEFRMGDDVFKICRDFFKGHGRSVLTLDFEIFNKTKGCFVSLTEKTVKQTEKKIEETIGIDFETFINSSFLKQGQADEFSKKSAKERKQILANILGLEKYDKLQRNALEKSRKFEEDARILEVEIKQLQEEVRKEKDLSNGIEKLSYELTSLKKQLKECRDKNLEYLKAKDVFLQRQREQKLIEKEKSALENEIKTLKLKFGELVRRWRASHRDLLSVPDREELFKKKSAIEKIEVEMQEKLQSRLSLEKKIMICEAQLQKRLNELKAEREKDIYSFKLEKERLKLEVLKLEEQLMRENDGLKKVEEEYKFLRKELLSEAEKKKLIENEKMFSVLTVQFEKRRTFYRLFGERGNRATVKIAEFQEKLKNLSANDNPSCPLCMQLLTAKRRNFLVRKFKNELNFYFYQINKVTFLRNKLKDLLVAQKEDLDALRKVADRGQVSLAREKELLAKKKSLENEFSLIKNKIEYLMITISKIKKQKSIVEMKVKEWEKEFNGKIESDATISSLNKQLKLLQQQYQAVSYDESKHKKLKVELSELSQAISRAIDFEKERQYQLERKQKLTFIKEKIRMLQHDLEKLFIKMIRKDDKLKISDLNKKISEIEEKESTLNEELNKKLEELGRIKNELFRIKKLKDRLKEQEKNLELIKQEIKDYSFLAKLFSKDGIQAILIEDAIPEIEREANNILSTLTNNQSQIFIESLRDLKKGGVKETLDIHISDSLGIRPYELFSGGESFRIDFALRIAISKLLVRRAGAALQTLIIDEGFGSQDEEGLARLQEAILSIKSDFAKIIVVSHLPAFKDNFPVHLVITKNTAGSIVQIEERG